MADNQISVIITAGPTNERIDAVMQITNMSTGRLGATVAETLLNTDGEHSRVASQIKTLYYLSPKLAVKPVVPDGQADKLKLVGITDAQSLLDAITSICNDDPDVKLIVHSCAVGDYKARYSARAEDIADEIAMSCTGQDGPVMRGTVLRILERPACTANDSTKMSSCEPNLMTMMDLTPKVVSSLRKLAPDACIFGFKLLENVGKKHLFDVASALRQKNDLDYVIANDLADIRDGRHPAMVIGRDGMTGTMTGQDSVFIKCETKQEIADAICRLAFPFGHDGINYVPAAGARTLWQSVRANNSDTRIQVQGFSYDRDAAWGLLFQDFKYMLRGLLPGADEPTRDEGLDGWEFYGTDGARASIGPNGAQVYDGREMWYWNLVPVSEYGPVHGDPIENGPAPKEAEKSVAWAACDGDGNVLPDAKLRENAEAAWYDMYQDFRNAMPVCTGLPEPKDMDHPCCWHVQDEGLAAAIDPYSAYLWDGKAMRRWRVDPVDPGLAAWANGMEGTQE